MGRAWKEGVSVAVATSAYGLSFGALAIVSGLDLWQTMVRPGRRLHPGDIVDFAEGLSAEIIETMEGGTRKVRFHYEGIFMETLSKVGSMPLPPYIRREAGDTDKERYQTVYSKVDGSVAAPVSDNGISGAENTDRPDRG